MKRKLLCLCAALLTLCPALHAQKEMADFKEVLDSLGTGLEDHFGVRAQPRIMRIVRRAKVLDFHFNQNLGEYPWHERDVKWFKDTLASLFPDGYKDCTPGSIICHRTPLQDFVTPVLIYKGSPGEFKHRASPLPGGSPVRELSGRRYSKGLSGRNIALWQSHGRYYDTGLGRWSWQRPPVNRTTEDLFTQSFVLPFLIPMLENSGAYVMTPRERSLQRLEVVCDNDPAFKGARELPLRQAGSYREKGSWSDAGEGFADVSAVYMLDQNPFTMGTARQAPCQDGSGAKCEARWSASVPAKGMYPVYVSYKTLENSTSEARYTVTHDGGSTTFLVNQRMGGGTWIYLGTFAFSGSATVTLSNTVSKNAFRSGSVVTADAVRIGGGMGKTARGQGSDERGDYLTSGLPAFAEGALYSMQWAGVDTTVTGAWSGEYSRDYASRGAWVQDLAKGSAVDPERKGAGKGAGKNIPVDISLAFHSDAGVTSCDSLIGTLAIYTLNCDGKDTYLNGRSRKAARTYADYVQTQVKKDIDATFGTTWRRREIWNRSYSESRTTGVPGMLLELLSHQNFADMKYGLDPMFKFTVSRAVYKGMLKFLSQLYGVPYCVQPLPVSDFAAVLSEDGSKATLSWKAVQDPLEPTASPTGYILYTRVGDGAFDRGVILKDVSVQDGVCSTVVALREGVLHSWRIAAYNSGGESFPSEALCAGYMPSAKSRVLVVNNFDRVSAPAWVDTPLYAGFDGRTDNGVPWGYDISFAGEQYEWRRDHSWISNENPGFGASRTNMAGSVIPGNTFDFVYDHARLLMERGYSVSSASRDAWCADADVSAGAQAVDLLCGKQRTTLSASGGIRHRVWPDALRERVQQWCSQGGGLVVSGAAIASDVSDCVYPWQPSEADIIKGSDFLAGTLGIKLVSARESSGNVAIARGGRSMLRTLQGAIHYNTAYVEAPVYCVENADAIGPAPGSKALVLLRYSDTSDPAAVAYTGETYRCVSFGFPLEVISDQEITASLLDTSLSWIAALKDGR